MEKVAIARRKEGQPPLVLIMNCAHFVRDDHDGQDLLEMFQQRAEQWAASGLVTTGKLMSMNHDNYLPIPVMLTKCKSIQQRRVLGLRAVKAVRNKNGSHSSNGPAERQGHRCP